MSPAIVQSLLRIVDVATLLGTAIWPPPVGHFGLAPAAWPVRNRHLLVGLARAMGRGGSLDGPLDGAGDSPIQPPILPTEPAQNHGAGVLSEDEVGRERPQNSVRDSYGPQVRASSIDER